MSNNNAVLFENYEREFNSLKEQINELTEELKNNNDSNSNSNNNNYEQIEDLLSEMDALVRRMDLEARSIDDTNEKKQDLMQKLRAFKALSVEQKSKFKGVRDDMERVNQRRQLFQSTSTTASASFGAGATGPSMLASSQPSNNMNEERRREQNSALDSMMKNTHRIEQTGERIRESKGRLVETEDLGAAILQDLHRQRETIVNSRESLRGADDTLSASRKILQTMSRRAQQNKLLFYLVVSVLVISIILVAYHKLNN